MHAIAFLISTLLPAGVEADAQTVIIVLGTPGQDEYAEKFADWGERWEAAAQRADARCVRIGGQAEAQDEKAPHDRDLLKQRLEELQQSKSQAVWLVLIGHGTFDGRQAKFNLQGPDVTANELAAWLKPLEQPLAVVNCASASGPFLNLLSAQNRVIVTATKSGYELNYARFGDYFSSAIGDPSADLDKDGQTSLLEAYLKASAGVAEFYEQEGRLATEHPLLDDNGDALGTPFEWFRGFRAVKTAKEGAVPDGERANQFILICAANEVRFSEDVRQRRDQLEQQIAHLRSNKQNLPEAEYYQRLEPLLVELARLYEAVETP